MFVFFYKKPSATELLIASCVDEKNEQINVYFGTKRGVCGVDRSFLFIENKRNKTIN